MGGCDSMMKTKVLFMWVSGRGYVNLNSTWVASDQELDVFFSEHFLFLTQKWPNMAACYGQLKNKETGWYRFS